MCEIDDGRGGTALAGEEEADMLGFEGETHKERELILFCIFCLVL